MTTPFMPICLGCRHFHADTHVGASQSGTCDAFPKGIPMAIWQNATDHRQPYTGDHGVHFQPKTAADAQYADDLFADDTTDMADTADASRR